MKKIIDFKGVERKDKYFPSFELFEKEILRVEFKKTETLKNDKSFLTKKLSNCTVSVEKQGKKDVCKNIFSSLSIKEYLSGKGRYNSLEINSFVEEIRCSPEMKILSLPIGLQNVIFLKVLSKNSKSLLLSTAGMHLEALVCTYKILNGFLNKGGCCVELTYPPVSDIELDEILGVKLKKIGIG